jgi:FlaG/FlaF family flagellin (archaellin)
VRPAKAAAVLAVVAGAIFASVLPSSADVSAQSPSQAGIRVQSPAERLARGAAVRVELLVTCPASTWQSSVSVRLSQRVGSGVATGYGYAGFTCTGGLQSVTVTVQAEQNAFRASVAYATGSLSGTGSNTVYDDREIEIVNP